MTLVAAFVEKVHNLRTEEKFCHIWNEVVTQIDTHSRRIRRDNTLLQNYVVEETTGNNEMNKDEIQRLFSRTSNQLINKMEMRFSHQNTKIYTAVFTL